MPSISLFPLNTILFPDGRLPLQVFEVRYLDLVKRCVASGEEFGVVPLLQGSEIRRPDQQELLAGAGTMARVQECSSPMAGLLQIECIGTRRFHLRSASQLKHGLWMGEADFIEEDRAIPIPEDQQNVANALGTLIRSMQTKQISLSRMALSPPFRLDESGWVANRWCELLRVGLDQKERLLMQENPVLRLELVQDLLADSGLLD